MKIAQTIIMGVIADYNAKTAFESAKQKSAATLKKELALFTDKDSEKEAERAINWWRKLNNKFRKRFLFVDEVEAATDNWLFMKSLVARNDLERRNSSEMHSIANALRTMMPELNPINDDMDVVYCAISRFVIDTETEKVTRESKKIVKASLDDLVEDKEGNLVIDTTVADEFTKVRIKVERNQKNGKIKRMRIVNTTESGLSRDLDEEIERAKAAGIDVSEALPIALFVDTDPFKDLEGEDRNDENKKMAALKAHYAKLNKFLNFGFTDRATGRHYMHSQKGASMTRKATHFCLPSLENWKDIRDFWCRIADCTPEELGDAFGEVALSKVISYLALTMSGSYNPKTSTNPEMLEVMKRYNNRVLFTKDCIIYVNRPYRKMVQDQETEDSTYHFEEILSDPQEKTLSDGSGCKTVEYTLDEGFWQKDITGVEYCKALAYWALHTKKGGSLKTASRWFLDIVKRCASRQVRYSGTGIKGMINVVDKTGLVATKTYREVCYIIPKDVNPDDVVDLSKFDLFIPKSMIKFMVPGRFDCTKLNVCATNKPKKDRFVRMNYQFVSSLFWKEGKDITAVAKEWVNLIYKSMDDPMEAAKFHNAFGSANSDVTSILKEVIKDAPFLMDEPYIHSLRKKQYEKAFRDISLCNIPVPGIYGYEIPDPYNFMNVTFGTNALELPSGYSYSNGDGGEAMLFRSPLLMHKCAVKTKLLASEEYRHYSVYVDCVVFNGYDGLWDMMSGSDFDGDTCERVTDNTEIGKIICDGYREDGLEVNGYSKSGPKVRVDFTNVPKLQKLFCDYFATHSHVDRTGLITRYCDNARELANHLRMLAKHARIKGVNVNFIDPVKYGYGGGCGVYPEFKGDVIEAKGLCPYLGYDKKTKSQEYDYASPWSLVGVKTPEEIDTVALWIEENPVSAMFVYQSQEIDGAKTGFLPTLIKSLCLTIESRNVITMQKRLKKGMTDEEFNSARRVNNSYMSISTAGLIRKMMDRDVYDMYYAKNGQYLHHAMTDEYGRELLDANGNPIPTCRTKYDQFMSSNTVHAKTDLVNSLLTDEERAALTKEHHYNGTTWTILSSLRDIRTEYCNEIKDFREYCNEDVDDMSVDDREELYGNLTMNDIKDKYIARILGSAERLGVSEEVLAAGCYIANYTDKNGKDRSNIKNSNSFAWLLWDQLLNVFMRKDDTWQLVECHDDGVISVADGVMYADGNVVTTIDAYDIDNARTTVATNGKKYAYIHMHANAVRKDTTIHYSIADRKTFKVNLFAIKTKTAADALSMIRQNGGFDVRLEADNEGTQLCAYIDDFKLGVLNINRNMTAMINLDGKRIALVNDTVHLTAKSIVGLEVAIA